MCQNKKRSETSVFAREAPTLPLSDDLQFLVHQAAAGKKLDLIAFFGELTLWKGIKIRAEENNHRGDAKAQHDRILKAV